MASHARQKTTGAHSYGVHSRHDKGETHQGRGIEKERKLRNVQAVFWADQDSPGLLRMRRFLTNLLVAVLRSFSSEGPDSTLSVGPRQKFSSPRKESTSLLHTTKMTCNNYRLTKSTSGNQNRSRTISYFKDK